MTNLALLLGGFFSIYLTVLMRVNVKRIPTRKFVHQVVRDSLIVLGGAAIVGLCAGSIVCNMGTEPYLAGGAAVIVPFAVGVWALVCWFWYMVSTFFVAEKALTAYPPKKLSLTVLFLVASLGAIIGYVPQNL